MSFICSPIGNNHLSDSELKEDRNNCQRFGPCGAGLRALYLNGRFFDRRFYIVWEEVGRVYKRVAISKGAYTGKGIFASMPFLVVEHGAVKHEFSLKREEDADALLEFIANRHPEIPVHSEDALRKLREAEAEEKSRYLEKLEPEAEKAVAELENDREFLEERTSLSSDLVSAAKNKRVIDNIPPSFKLAGICLAAAGVIAALYGLYRLISHQNLGLYFIAGGAIAFFVSLSSNALPTKWNSKKEAELRWKTAVDAMRTHLEERPAFEIPPQYAHPVVINRIIRVVREGRARDAMTGLEVVKEDLKALNSSVTVSQKEYDEVVVIKPLFLVCDYKNELQD